MAKDVRLLVKDYFERFPRRRINKGQIIILADSRLEFVYYMNSGRVRQYFIFEDGSKVTVNIFGAGAFFPMSYIINDYPNRYFFEAVEDAEVNCVPPEKALEFIKSDPDIVFDLLSRVYRGTEGLLQKMSYMMANDTYRLVIFEIVIECKRNKDPERNNQIVLSETELATHVGLARGTVNRQLAKLKKSGLIMVSKNGVVVSDLDALEKLL